MISYDRSFSDRAEADDWQIGLYGTLAFKNSYSLKAWLGYGWQSYDLFRHPLGAALSGSFKGSSTTAALEFAREIPTRGGLTIAPALGLEHRRVRQDSFSERGDDVLSLHFDSSGYDETKLYAGAYLRQILKKSSLYASAFYKRRLGGRGLT